MAFDKVTVANHLPGTGDERFPVYAKQLNEALNKLNGNGTPEPIVSLKATETVVPVADVELTTIPLTIEMSGGTYFIGPVSDVLQLNLPTTPPNGTWFTLTLIAAEVDANVVAAGTDIFAGQVNDGAGTSTTPGEGQVMTFAGGAGNSSTGDSVTLQYRDGIWFINSAACLTADGITFPEE